MVDVYEVSLSDGSTAKVCTPQDLSWAEAAAKVEDAISRGYRTHSFPPVILGISRAGSAYLTVT